MAAKFKVSQLSAKPKEIEMVHPVFGETGVKVKLAGPSSRQFLEAKEKYDLIEKPTEQDGTVLFVSTVLGWDEEAFEMEFSQENALEYFSSPENSWARGWLISQIRDYAQFFHTDC